MKRFLWVTLVCACGGADKKEITIASVKVVPDQVKVYNFATNPYATYVANGVIVHNKPPIPTEGITP